MTHTTLTLTHNKSDAITPHADDWAQLAGEWLTNFRSDATQRTYKAAWAEFLSWLGKHPADATRTDVIVYRDDLTQKGAKAATGGVRLAALASFYKRARAEGLIARNPAPDIDRPKVEAYAGAHWLTTSEARTLLQSPNCMTLEGKRDYAILVVMLTMGLRRKEVATMRRGAVRLRGDGQAELRYAPKGGDEQTRPMPAVAWQAIQAYPAARGDIASDVPMFVAHDRAANLAQ